MNIPSPVVESVQQSNHASYSTLKEFMRFLVVGAANTTLNFLLYSLCIFVGLNPPLSAVVAFVGLIPIHLKAHASFVFRSQLDISTVLKSSLSLAISMGLNVGLVTVFWAYLLADPIPAQVLSIGPAVAANYMLLKFFVFSRFPVLYAVRSVPRLPLLTAGVAVLAVYVSVAAILLYTNPFLFSDDWRHYNHYFFERDLWTAIFGRENGHLMILPNLIFLVNYTYFDGRMSNLALTSVALLTAAGLLVAISLLKATRIRRQYPTLCVFLICEAMLLFLGAPVSLFWGMGVHNHLVVLGVAGAAFFAAGMAGPLRNPLPALGFITFATVASTSFTTGAAAWLLGFIGVLASRERFRVHMAFFGLGLVGFAATVLPLLHRDEIVATVVDIFALILFSAAVFGNMFPTMGADALPKEAFGVSVAIGCLGFLVTSAAVARVLARGTAERTRDAYCFFSLIAIFVFVAGLMIGHGRMDGEIGLHAALYPRFATWSLLGWTGVVGMMLLMAHELDCKFDKQWVFHSAALCLSILILYGNVQTIDTKLRYAYAYHMDTLTQAVANHTARPTERRLWRSREDVWLKVIGHLRQNGRNIYKEQWPYLMDRDMSHIWHRLKQHCVSNLEILSTDRSDERKIRGWILPGAGLSPPLLDIAFLDSAGYVVGFAKPVFGSGYGQDARYRQHMVWPARMVRTLGTRNISDLPGLSGHVLGRIRTAASETSSLERELRFVAATRAGWSCKGRYSNELKNPREGIRDRLKS